MIPDLIYFLYDPGMITTWCSQQHWLSISARVVRSLPSPKL